jgi:hypothetical protein
VAALESRLDRSKLGKPYFLTSPGIRLLPEKILESASIASIRPRARKPKRSELYSPVIHTRTQVYKYTFLYGYINIYTSVRIYVHAHINS